MKCPEPTAEIVADYMAERITAGLFAEDQSLDLPAASTPCFIGLADELDGRIRDGAVNRWLAGVMGHGFSEEFVKALVAFMNNCLDPRRARLC